MRVIKSNRLVRGHVGVTNTTTEPRRFTQRIELVRKLEILAFHSPNALDISVELTNNSIIVIQGSQDAVNDGVYRVVGTDALGENLHRATVAHADFKDVAPPGAYVIQAQEIRVVHGLNTDPMNITLRNELDGCYYEVAVKYIDANTILLTPHAPMEGVFVLSVSG